MKGKIKKSSLTWVVKNASGVYLKIFLMTAFSSIFAMLGVRMALTSKALVDTASGQAEGNWVHNAVILGIILIAQLTLSAIIKNLNMRATGRLTINMKNSIFGKILSKKWQDVSAYHSGDLLNRINNDVNVVVSGVMTILPAFVGLATRLIAGFGAMFTLDATFSAAILCMGPVVMLLARLYSKKMKYFHKKVQECDGKTSSFMQESIQNILMIKSFSSENYMEECANDLQETSYKIKLKRNTISIFAHLGLSFIFSLGSSVALIWGAYKISIGLMTFGTLMAFVQIINQVQTPFMNISTLLPQFYSMLASAERIMEIEMLETEVSDTVCDRDMLYTDMSSIEVDNISFSYDKETILSNASYEIKKGNFVAIAGTSGVGKSTLLKLILGIIIPSGGQIYIKKSDGGKIATGKSVRGLYAYVPQGNMILSGTIRDNIKFSCKEASNEDIIRCAKAACIWDFIAEQPEGLDTVIGERGLGLSEGQVQRLAIARALLYDAPILLLDEATSALDEQTEADVLKNIRNYKEKTCIIISHKKAAMDIADEVITIKDGKILNFL